MRYKIITLAMALFCVTATQSFPAIPQMTVSDESLDFGYYDTQKNIAITNNSDAQFSWHAETNVPWLKVEPQNGIIYSASQLPLNTAYRSSKMIPDFPGRAFQDAITVGIDHSGYIYVSMKDKITKFNRYGEIIYELNTKGGKIAFDSQNNIYVLHSSEIIKFNQERTMIQRISSDNFNSLAAIAINKNDEICVADATLVHKIDKSGTYVKSFARPADKSWAGDIGMVVDSKGDIYIADNHYGRIRKFDAEGNLIKYWGNNITFGSDWQIGEAFAIDDNDSIYIGNEGSALRKFDTEGNEISIPNQCRNMDGIAIGEDDSIYGLTWNTYYNNWATKSSNPDYLLRFDSDGVPMPIWDKKDSKVPLLNFPANIALDNAGNIIVADYQGIIRQSIIKNISIHGELIKEWAVQGIVSRVFIQPTGNIYILLDVTPTNRGAGNASEYEIIKLDNASTVIAKCVHILPNQEEINDFIVDQAGSFYYITDSGMFKLATNGTELQRWTAKDLGGSNSFKPRHIIFSGGKVTVSDDTAIRVITGADGTTFKLVSEQRIVRTDNQGTILCEITGFSNANDIAVGTDGKLYIADTGNSRIQVLSPAISSLNIAVDSTQIGALMKSAEIKIYNDSANSINPITLNVAVNNIPFSNQRPVISNSLPENVSFSFSEPVLNVNTPLILKATYRDNDGVDNIEFVQLLVNSVGVDDGNTFSDKNSYSADMALIYSLSQNKIFCGYSGGDRFWKGYPEYTGYFPIQDIQPFKFDCSKAKVYKVDAKTLTVEWPVLFQSRVSDKVRICMGVTDQEGAFSWSKMAEVNILGTNRSPQPVSLAPNSGNLPIRTPLIFKTLYTDPDGIKDLGRLYIFFGKNNNYSASYDNVRGQLSSFNSNAVALDQNKTKIYPIDDNTLAIEWAIIFSGESEGEQTVGLMANDTAGYSTYKEMGKVNIQEMPANILPVVISCVPSSGVFTTDTPLTFTATYSDENGVADIDKCGISFASSKIASGDKAELFVDSTGTLFSASNGADKYVSIDKAKTRVYKKDDKTLAVDWVLTFMPTITGNVDILLTALDKSQVDNPFVKKGAITVQQKLQNTLPFTGALTPNSGVFTVNTQVIFEAEYLDRNGVEDIAKGELQFQNANHTIRLMFDNTTNTINLMGDDGQWITPPSLGNVVENQYVKFDYSKSRATKFIDSGIDLIQVKYCLEFKDSFTGISDILSAVTEKSDQGRSGETIGWDKKGSITVQSLQRLPATGPVTPNSGNYNITASYTFNAQYSDKDGTDDILFCELRIGGNNSFVRLVFDNNSKLIHLMGDDGKWIYGQPAGKNITAENQYVKLDYSKCKISTVTANGIPAISVDFGLIFKNSFAGTKDISSAVTEKAGQGRSGRWIGWDTKGSINITASDTTAPVLAITAPQDRAELAYQDINFTGTATDASGIAEVRVYVYDYSRSSWVVSNALASYNSGNNQWSYTVSKSLLKQGQFFRLWARAKDKNGNLCAWQNRIVYINSATPITPSSLRAAMNRVRSIAVKAPSVQ